MRLSDQVIITQLMQGSIGITPPPEPSAISGVTIDLRLGNTFRVFENHNRPYIDLSLPKDDIDGTIKAVMSDEIKREDGEEFFIHPGQLVLGVTKERVTIPPTLVGWLDGRSSLARLGLLVHVTAHRIDPGFDGNIVLEFYNAGRLPLVLRPGMKICAISFEEILGTVDKPYSVREDSRYKNQSSAEPARG